MGGEAGGVAEELRAVFDSGVTANVEWRLRQLNALLRLLTEREAELCVAVSSDLGKSSFEVVFAEVCTCF